MQCNVSAQSEIAQPLVLINFGMNLAQRHRITLQVKKNGLVAYLNRNMWRHNMLIGRHLEK